MELRELEENFGRNQRIYITLKKHSKYKEAEEIYWDKLFPVVEKKFLKHIQERKRMGEIPEYDVLIIPMGTTSKFYTLLINGLKPEKVYFLCVPSDEKNYLERIIEKTGLSPSQYEKIVVNLEDLDTPLAYERIKEMIEKSEGKRIAIDLSRGKRSVVAGAAIAGEFFNCDLIHISKDWDENIRVPGTEKLVILNKSLYLFGDLENKHASQLFNRCNYGSASRIFEEVMEKSEDPREFELKYLISSAYSFWDGFYYRAAFCKLKNAIKKSEQYHFKWKFIPQLRDNLKVLKVMEKIQDYNNSLEILKDSHLVSHLIIDLYCNAGRRRYQNRFEDAVSRLYRALEMISQHRLALMGINTSKPEKHKIEGVISRFEEIARMVYSVEKHFPNKIPLMDGHILLFAMGDKFWENQDIEDLKRLQKIINLRDQSLVAHGLCSIDQKTYLKFKTVSKELIMRFFKLYNKDCNKLLKLHTHIKLPE